MYVKAFLKDHSGNIQTVEARSEYKTIIPQNPVECFKYGIETDTLVLKLILKLRKYANPNYALIEIHTDNALLAKKLMDEGYNVVFDPYPEEEMTKSEP
jgi:hypothetical protein